MSILKNSANSFDPTGKTSAAGWAAAHSPGTAEVAAAKTPYLASKPLTWP